MLTRPKGSFNYSEYNEQVHVNYCLNETKTLSLKYETHWGGSEKRISSPTLAGMDGAYDRQAP